MGFVYLIRHPKTRPDPKLPAAKWLLSTSGQAQVDDLVAVPIWSRIAAIYTSEEEKAALVGEAVQVAHDVPFTIVGALGEVRRDQWLEAEAFDQAQRVFFSQVDVPPIPDWESAEQAGARFAAAMDRLLSWHPASESIAVVAHATVLALYVAMLRGEPPSFHAWREMGFGTIMAVNRATMQATTGFLAAPFSGLPLP